MNSFIKFGLFIANYVEELRSEGMIKMKTESNYGRLNLSSFSQARMSGV